ncbi:hypothetical protein [Massilia consociata]|uniref:Uncharacterized protein n=1 Tax=Massilia consociata TaxID=760117 RepID=A0ABV6FFB7_9BURK
MRQKDTGKEGLLPSCMAGSYRAGKPADTMRHRHAVRLSQPRQCRWKLVAILASIYCRLTPATSAVFHTRKYRRLIYLNISRQAKLFIPQAIKTVLGVHKASASNPALSQ